MTKKTQFFHQTQPQKSHPCKLLFSVADDQSPSKVRTYRSKNFGKKDIEIATDLMRELDPNNTLASAKWGQGFREEKDKVGFFWRVDR